MADAMVATYYMWTGSPAEKEYVPVELNKALAKGFFVEQMTQQVIYIPDQKQAAVFVTVCLKKK